MKKILIYVLTMVTIISCLTACNLSNEKTNQFDEAESLFTAYENLVTKDEFQKQYKEAFNNRQPDYKKDFVYTYSHYSAEIYEDSEDINTTNEKTQYDADSQIVLIHHKWQTNDTDDSENEDFFYEYKENEGMIEFYNSKTKETETRQLGFDEFWEFAHNQVPMILFPNPNKLFDDKTYYIDLDKNGDTVFTLYSGNENDYLLSQIVFSDTEMICREKKYSKDSECEDITYDIYRIYNEEITLTSISDNESESE